MPRKEINLRLSKLFAFGGRYELEIFGEVFNLFDEETFSVASSQRDFGSDEFGIPDSLITDPQEFQIGVRLQF